MNKLAILIFTFPRDYAVARRALDCALDRWERTGLPEPDVIFAVHERDAESARKALLPVPATDPHVRVITHAFDAGGSLRWSEAVHGMRGVFRRVFADAAHYDALLKLDSDTRLLRPEAFTSPVRDCGVGFVAVRRYMADSTTLGSAPKERPVPNLCNGCAYLLTREAFAAIDAAPPAVWDHALHLARGHEDMTFSHLATNCDGVFFAQIAKPLCVFDAATQTITADTVYAQEPAGVPAEKS